MVVYQMASRIQTIKRTMFTSMENWFQWCLAIIKHCQRRDIKANEIQNMNMLRDIMLYIM